MAASGAAVAAIGGSLIMSDASNNAADAQSQSNQRGIDESRRQYDQTRADFAPYRQVGQSALYKLSDLMGLGGGPSGAPAAGGNASGPVGIVREGNKVFNRDTGAYMGRFGVDPGVMTIGDLAPQLGVSSIVDESGNNLYQGPAAPASTATTTPATPGNASGDLMRKFSLSDFQVDPGYQFRLSEGEKGINRAAIAGGRYDSGRALKDLQRFDQGLASDEYGNAYNRFNTDQTNKFNRLSALAGTGQTATSQVANIGSTMAANNAQLYSNSGAAQARGIQDSAAYLGNGINSAVGGYLYQNRLNQQSQPNYASSYTGGSFYVPSLYDQVT